MSESRYDISDAERHECFGVTHTMHTMRANDDLPPAPCECGRDLTDEDRDAQDGVCAKCREVLKELEMDNAWSVWLAGLKSRFDQDHMEAVSDSLSGWKYIGGDIEHERTSKGVSIASANNLRFLAPGHRGHLIFSNQNGLPVIIINGGTDHKYPDWTATFTSWTPLETILAACNAVIHTQTIKPNDHHANRQCHAPRQLDRQTRNGLPM